MKPDRAYKACKPYIRNSNSNSKSKSNSNSKSNSTQLVSMIFSSVSSLIMDMTCNCWPFASAIERLPARPPKRDLILKIWDILNVLDLGIPLFAGTMSH